MRRLFLVSCDNFKHSHVKVKTGTNLSDVTFTEFLLRGRQFKNSRNILTVLATESLTQWCGNVSRKDQF